MPKTISPVDLLEDVQQGITDAKLDALKAYARTDDPDLALDLQEVMDRLEDLIQYTHRKIGKYQRELA